MLPTPRKFEHVINCVNCVKLSTPAMWPLMERLMRQPLVASRSKALGSITSQLLVALFFCYIVTTKFNDGRSSLDGQSEVITAWFLPDSAPWYALHAALALLRLVMSSRLMRAVGPRAMTRIHTSVRRRLCSSLCLFV